MPPTDDPARALTLEAMQAARREAEAGQIDQASALYRAVLELDPGHAGAHFGLGSLELRGGDLAAAIGHFASALQSDPGEEGYWLAYIDALMEARQFVTAGEVIELGRRHGLDGPTVDAFEQQLKQASEPPAQEIEAAADLYAQRRLEEAGNAARALTERFPQHPFGWKLLGAVQYKTRAIAPALESMRKAVSYAPDDSETLTNMGLLLNSVGRLDEALNILTQAIALKPDNAHAHNHLATSLMELGRWPEARASATTATTLRPDFLEAWHTLAVILDKQGQSVEAVEHYRRVLEKDPDNADVRGNMLFCMSHMENISPDEMFEEHRLFGQRQEARVQAWRSWDNTREPERRLRVGIVSGDLRNHAVATFIEPILGQLAGRPGLALHAYYNFPVHDGVTSRVRSHMAQWRDVSALDDERLCALIREDGVDILIDLSGHTAHNRLTAFARKPAPLQVSWIGYPGTTGLTAMDYYVTDRFILPPGRFDHHFTEKLALLPVTIAFMPSIEAPAVAPLPALANGHVTFGSFNRLNKITRDVIAVWARLLRALPDSRLLVGGMPQGGGHEKLQEWLAEEGIEPQRTSFHPTVGMRDYLPMYGQVDICLDTFPYSGGTTTMYALYMGVPTLTLAGTTMASRQTACLLEANGLQHYIAHDAAEFVAKGIAASQDLASLAQLRPALRSGSPLWRPDAVARLADSVELALRMMWRRWCAGLPAAAFEVPPADQA